MGSRILEPGRRSYNSVPKYETDGHSNHGFVLKPVTPSYSRKSSICWPGVVVHDLCGHITPSRTGRYRLHDFPRNLYCRTIYSKSRSKGKSKNDALDHNYGSVGPIHCIRNKFVSEARSRGSILLNPYNDASPFQRASASKWFVPMPENNLEPAETSKHWQGDHSANRFKEPIQSLSPAPCQAVKRILEQLDRSKPTPKEKAAELNLAMSGSKSLPEASNAVQKENISVLGSGKFGSLQNTDSLPHLLTQGSKNDGNSDRFTKLQKRSIEAEDALQKKKGRWEERVEHRSISQS